MLWNLVATARALTSVQRANTIAPMTRFSPFTMLIASMLLALCLSGCGVAYQTGTRLKASHMSNSLEVGETSIDVHRRFGEPDIRQYLPGNTEVWSYPYKPNSNDITAQMLYTSSKDGDSGTFLDLKFVNGKLVSWMPGDHTMTPKAHTGLGVGIGGGPIGNGTETTPGAVHY
jgi:outer membrane protein assembly factor BamE (lipoprotein component of BamABCDE complex)